MSQTTFTVTLVGGAPRPRDVEPLLREALRLPVPRSELDPPTLTPDEARAIRDFMAREAPAIKSLMLAFDGGPLTPVAPLRIPLTAERVRARIEAHRAAWRPPLWWERPGPLEVEG